MKTDVAFNKLAILTKAIKETTNTELDQAAFDILLNGKAFRMEDWIEELMQSHMLKVAKEYGDSASYAMKMLETKWYAQDYYDESTGLAMTFEEWSECFSNEISTKLYKSLFYAVSRLSKYEPII